MTAVKAGDVDRAVATRRPGTDLLLFYGPDAGRVAERARLAAEAAVDDKTDPFSLIRLDGDALADHPAKLVEEATTFGMFGGRRAVWIRPTGRSIAAAVEACLDVALVDTLVVVEAGDLSKSAPLRALCERSPRALALPCYADEKRDIGSVITEALGAHGLTIDRDARDLLVDSLGGDRLATRGEIEKLALYVHGAAAVTVADVEAVVSDVSAPSIDAVLDAAFGGDRAALDAALSISLAHGATIQALLSLGLRHALALLAGVAIGDPDSALRGWRGLHFRRRETVARQIRSWRETEVRLAIEALQQAALASRRDPALGEAVTAQALYRIAGRFGSVGRDAKAPA